MYGGPGSTSGPAASAGVGGAAVLASTGLDFLWWAIAAVALIGCGAALLRFVPRKES